MIGTGHPSPTRVRTDDRSICTRCLSAKALDRGRRRCRTPAPGESPVGGQGDDQGSHRGEAVPQLPTVSRQTHCGEAGMTTTEVDISGRSGQATRQAPELFTTEIRDAFRLLR